MTSEQAAAFRSKLWQLHIDARQANATDPKTSEGVDTIIGYLNSMGRDSSADAEASGPFKERIRTGMVVVWRPPRGHVASQHDGIKIVVVLCPAGEAGVDSVTEFNGDKVNVAGAAAAGSYVCALVQPAVLHGAYELKMWRQVVVAKEWMDKEVVLEYDPATRFYHLAV